MSIWDKLVAAGKVRHFGFTMNAATTPPFRFPRYNVERPERRGHVGPASCTTGKRPVMATSVPPPESLSGPRPSRSLGADIIIANAPDPVFVSDLEGKILQAN